MYAIIETGGKQYKVAEGDIITVEKLGVEAGQEYTFDKVLVLAKDGDVKVGAPYVEGAAVTASVIGDGKAKKVVVYKYKPKKGFHKKNFIRKRIKSVHLRFPVTQAMRPMGKTSSVRQLPYFLSIRSMP